MNNKYIVFIFLNLSILTALTSCSDWTTPEAENYFEPVSEEYKANLKTYLSSTSHKKMFGWFGNWAGKTGSSMQYSLCGLPDSVDFVSLWLCWGNLTQAQQQDLKEFQQRGARAILCWRAGDIGDNLTPGGNDDAVKEAFWGFREDDVESRVSAAKKYALAIADTCAKYNIDGFDYDIEDWGTLMDSSHPEVANAFMRTLREEFTKTDRWLVADIPGNQSWLVFYDVLDDDVVESLNYIIWQTYDFDVAELDEFFSARYGVKTHKPDIFDNVMKKSIITSTFEEAAKKYLFSRHSAYHPSCGIENAGMGAYHIEYDYSGNPDYPTVRSAIHTQNQAK